ncbi:SIS domain-containing protein [Labrenzia sp. 011]|uniref:SIS domain-containing protein n=1 Tax=Labrenzia sp. 011 TaxID=2171494 RepID=UPI000D50E2B6|nr:SIS domain-containing protein [Labrenzia sp. 011]PVB59524.1 hypothetical protein DCO57_21915 [Labrenzia sp. 011]
MNATMRREIDEQVKLLPELQPRLAEAADGLPRACGRILAGGCGDSAFAPQALQAVCRAMNLPLEAKTSMDIACFTPLTDTDTVVLSSISGGTKRTVEAASAARAAGARVIAITCHGDSALADVATRTVVLPFTPLSRKTPHTLDYTITLLSIAEVLRSQAGLADTALAPATSDLGMLLRGAKERVGRISEDHRPEGKLIILGADGDLGTANYTAAKFHEAGGLVTFCAETENFVHGMNFMLDPEDTLVVLGSTEAAVRRGRSVVNAFSSLCRTYLLTTETGHAAPDVILRRVFQLTFMVQELCLAVSDKLGLSLEAPRAGRPRGAEHLEAQTRAMAS